MPELDVREAEGLDDEVEAQRLGRPDQAGEDDERSAAGARPTAPKTPSSNRS